MSGLLGARLGLMMFLNYAIWGAWYVTLGTYLTATLKFSGTEAGAIFGTTALACMISPFFVGLVADRFFAAERVLATLHLAGAALLYLVTRVSSFSAVYAVMLAYCLFFFPTVSLTNSLSLRQLSDATKEFPIIRVFCSLGWIAIGQVIGHMGVETSATPFLLASGASVAMSLYCLTLPHTPPESRGKAVTARTILGLDALGDAAQPVFSYLRRRLGAGLHSAHVLLLIHERLPERLGRGERGGKNDAGAGIGSRRNAADAASYSSGSG